MKFCMKLQPSRREFTALAGAALGTAMLAPPALAETANLIARAIPNSGELLPAVGLGTAQIFNTNDETTRQKANAVIAALIADGGKVIDTASSYGDAEGVIGDVLAAGKLRQKIFIATKLEAPDEAELKRSLGRLKTDKVDLLFLHNVRDRDQSLEQFRDWKKQGVCRTIGITSTFHGDYGAVEAVLQRERPDVVEIDYSIDDREAEKRILPLGRRGQGRRLHRAAVRPRPPVPRRPRQGGARLGPRLRRELGAVLPQIPHQRPAGDRPSFPARRTQAT